MIDIDLLLASGAAFKKVAKSTVIFREDDGCRFYYQLVSGQVSWLNVNEEGKPFIYTLIAPGESFGEMALFDDGPYAATTIAVEDSIVIRLHKPVFLQLLRENQSLSLKFNRLLASRLRYHFLLLNSFAHGEPEQRIKVILDHLKKEKRNLCADCSQLKLTRQQIADMTGLRVETVIRSMRSMHEKGELQINKGKVFC
ncbi:MAG: Crp/Fnr family transcriptional regulator [Chitinophagaceae bacterium]|nr:MAG: Crp/Fnr family transcriptional regulator [Chitinophagaceae bacterium]